MVGIVNVASYVPDNYERNLDKLDLFGIDADFVINKIGVEQVSRKTADEETSDLCLKAFERLQEQYPTPLRVDCIVVCTQNPDGRGIPHTSAVLHGKLGLSDDCACFDISLGCSGYVYSLSIVKSFMEANGYTSGLLFTADPYSKILNPEDKNTVLLFGDAATVTLLQDYDSHERILVPTRFSFATNGRKSEALHNRNEYLFMDGMAIFNLIMKQVPLQIHMLIHASGRSFSEIDCFLFHQASKYVIDQLCKRLNIPNEKVPINIAMRGNTVSSSLPLLIEEYFKTSNWKHVMMSGFGVGLSWASCLLEIYQ